jgi:hypothetical protein
MVGVGVRVRVRGAARVVVAFVFGRKLQYQPVRGVNTREECHWSHAWLLQGGAKA